MREVGAAEAETSLGRLLEWVEAGEEVVITRSGRPWRGCCRRLWPSMRRAQKWLPARKRPPPRSAA